MVNTSASADAGAPASRAKAEEPAVATIQRSSGLASSSRAQVRTMKLRVTSAWRKRSTAHCAGFPETMASAGSQMIATVPAT